MLTRARLTAAVLAAAALPVILLPLRAAENVASPCTISSGPTRLQGIGEASGLTLSRKTPDLLWSHNDSGAPVLFGIDRSGVRMQVRMPKATGVLGQT